MPIPGPGNCPFNRQSCRVTGLAVRALAATWAFTYSLSLDANAQAHVGRSASGATMGGLADPVTRGAPDARRVLQGLRDAQPGRRGPLGEDCAPLERNETP
jgi:hypothetical protein